MTTAAIVALVVRYGLVLLFLPFSALDKIFGFDHAVEQAQSVFKPRPIAIAMILIGLVRRDGLHARRRHRHRRSGVRASSLPATAQRRRFFTSNSGRRAISGPIPMARDVRCFGIS